MKHLERLVTSTTEPQRTALVLDHLLAFVDGAPPQDGREELLYERLAVLNEGGALDRMAEVFRSRPTALRERVFGSLPEGYLRSMDPTDRQRLTGGAPAIWLHEVDAEPPPLFPADTRFTIWYEGFACLERTGDRFLVGPSDETYVLTSAVHVGEGVDAAVDTLRHPVGSPVEWYGDVDSGEFRVGPRAPVWTAAKRDVVVVTTVMEHDEEDPGRVREIVDDAVKAAAELIQYSFGFATPDWLRGLLVEIVAWVIDPADDPIGMASHHLDGEELRTGAAVEVHPTFAFDRDVVDASGPFQFETRTELVDTGLPFFFITRHTDDGHYVVCYVVTADQAPLSTGGVAPDERLRRRIQLGDIGRVGRW